MVTAWLLQNTNIKRHAASGTPPYTYGHTWTSQNSNETVALSTQFGWIGLSSGLCTVCTSRTAIGRGHIVSPLLWRYLVSWAQWRQGQAVLYVTCPLTTQCGEQPRVWLCNEPSLSQYTVPSIVIYGSLALMTTMCYTTGMLTLKGVGWCAPLPRLR